MQQATTEVGLSAAQLAILFPFHFVINRQFRLTQLGPSVSQNFDPNIRPGAYMDEFFEITTPASLLNWGYLRSMEREICSLRHKRTQIDFSARILPAGSDKLIFLIKPLINTESYLDRLGLSPSDFSNHDLINDLFLHRKNARSKSDLSLEDAVLSQEEQLKEIRQLFATQEAEARRLAHIISRSTYWIIIANTEGYIEWVNDAFLKSSGYASEDIIGSTLGSLLGIDAAEFDEFRQALQTEEKFQKESGFIDHGQARWIDIDVRALFGEHKEIINYIAIGRDITEQKQAQQVSQRLSMELNTIFDLSPDGFVSFDDTGRLSQVNRAFLKTTGLEETTLQGISSNDFETLLSGLNEYQPTAPDEAPNRLIKISYPRLAIIRRTVRAVAQANGDAQRLIHYFQDITHEYELSRMKGEFLSMAAHELRTPMASIFGFTDLLLSRSYSPEQSREILQNVHRQATRMTNLINDLLDLARIEAKGKLEFKPVDVALDLLITTALREFTARAPNRVVNIKLPQTVPTIKGDFDKLLQVLANLLSNADKYSRLDEEITIETDEKTADDVAYVGIRVIDAGVGMSQNDMNKLFQPFFRAASAIKAPGTGLGMCIVKEIMEAHSGTIEVWSQPEAGTRITAWIPKA